jgi:hypothetical protein
MKQLLERIEEAVNDALLERNDGVLRNRNRLRTHLPAACGDVAITDIVLPS